MGERMPAERTTMRQVREVLRLRTAGLGLNEIARRVGVAPSTVRLTLKRLASAGLSWPLPAEMTDTALEAALFAAAGTKQGHRRHVEPDWAEIHRELKRKHVTLTMLWDEYIERYPEGYRHRAGGGAVRGRRHEARPWTKRQGKSGTIDVKALLAEDEEFLRALVRTALQEVLEAEMTEALGAEKGERAAGRQGYRSGYYGRTLITRVGKLELRVPQDRAGRFSTELFERYQRSERALVAALAEMYVQGVSTRKVKAITEELCGHSFSPACRFAHDSPLEGDGFELSVPGCETAIGQPSW